MKVLIDERTIFRHSCERTEYQKVKIDVARHQYSIHTCVDAQKHLEEI